MSLFDAYVVVDWSAASVPVTGRDSIWIAHRRGDALTLSNPATRLAAEDELRALLADADAAGERVFLGFDFAFGYPEGTAAAFGGSWRDVWTRICDGLTEDAENANNRFELAGALNDLWPGDGPYWGHPHQHQGRYPGLTPRLPDGYGAHLPPRRRQVEQVTPGAQETWKLHGVGSVGGQSLTGIAMLERLRRDDRVAIWPFETLGDTDAGHLAVEVYPSLIPPAEAAVRDAGQVTAMAAAIAAADAEDRLAAMLAEPGRMGAGVVAEEGWILSAGDPAALTGRARPPTPPPVRAPGSPALRYLRDPAAIYAKSFDIVRREARLDRFPEALRPVLIRLIHSCGMVEIADRVAFSAGVAAAGRDALAQGAPVLCDCQMVASGISRTLLPAENPVMVTLNGPGVPDRAKAMGTTRSAAAVEDWRPHIDGAVVAIGNAPTALFHLLERLDDGWPRPAAIIGFPVGFVGAAESKAALAADPRGCDFIALRGRRGGSAMAAGVVNALAAGLGEATR